MDTLTLSFMLSCVAGVFGSPILHRKQDYVAENPYELFSTLPNQNPFTESNHEAYSTLMYIPRPVLYHSTPSFVVQKPYGKPSYKILFIEDPNSTILHEPRRPYYGYMYQLFNARNSPTKGYIFQTEKNAKEESLLGQKMDATETMKLKLDRINAIQNLKKLDHHLHRQGNGNKFITNKNDQNPCNI